MNRKNNSDNDIRLLKEKREELGLSLKDLFHQIRINVNYLQAIENGDFHILPQSIYARNFIKTYARALGVDEKIILAHYDDYLNSLNILEDIPPEDMPREKFFSSIISRHKTFLGGFFTFIIIFVVIWLVSMQYRPTMDVTDRSAIEKSIIIASEKRDVKTDEGESPMISPEQQKDESKGLATNASDEQTQVPAQSTTHIEETTTRESSVTASVASPQEVYKGEVNSLVIMATEETWIRIKADQNPAFQILLKPGQKVEYKAADFDMEIGNAGGVKLKFKGKSIEKLGESGEVIRLRLP